MFRCQIPATCWEICNYIYCVIIPLDAVSMVAAVLIKLWQGKKPIIWMRSLQENEEMHCPSFCPHVLIIQLLKELSHLRPKGLQCEYQPWGTANPSPGSALIKVGSETSLGVIESTPSPLKFTENKKETKMRLDSTVCYSFVGPERSEKGQLWKWTSWRSAWKRSVKELLLKRWDGSAAARSKKTEMWSWI